MCVSERELRTELVLNSQFSLNMRDNCCPERLQQGSNSLWTSRTLGKTLSISGKNQHKNPPAHHLESHPTRNGSEEARDGSPRLHTGVPPFIPNEERTASESIVLLTTLKAVSNATMPASLPSSMCCGAREDDCLVVSANRYSMLSLSSGDAD